ncbi:MAG TPA: AsmA family protein, partial [Gemmatimonadaceae bacterium]|nr:AsmA family protein [Gemmatimonadaceae bacterium]
MKKRTRILVAAGALLIALPLIALVTIPFLFRDRIVARVKSEANQSVDARVNWRGESLSLFRDFPNLTLGLDDFSIAGTGRFAGDTLAAVKRLQVVLDLGSVVRGVRAGAPIVVRSVELDRPVLALRVLEDGTANWDIAKETPADSGAARPFSVSLRRLDIRDAAISLDDRKTGLVASLTGYRQSLAGDFSQDVFDIQTRAHGDSLSVKFAGIPYLNRVALDVVAAVNADMKRKRFTFGRNEIRLNDLRLGFHGSATAADDRVSLDLDFNAPSTDFRHILSLVPAIYARDFQTIKTTGKVAVQGQVKGDYGEHAFPSFVVSAKVSDATFRYPDLPLPARDIALDLSLRNPGGSVDSTVVRLDRFHAVIGREPIDASLVLRTPVSDPDIDLRVAGKVDLADVRRTVKLSGVDELAGRIAADVAVRTRMSLIDSKQYDRIAARGTVDVAGLALKGADLPHPLMIDEAS